MNEEKQILEQYYESMGISRPVFRFCSEIEEKLKGRFAEIDAVAECNQMKVWGRCERTDSAKPALRLPPDTDIMIWAGRRWKKSMRMCLARKTHWSVRRLPAGTHALALALMSQLRPGDELLSPVGKPYDTLEEVIGIRPSNGPWQSMGSPIVRWISCRMEALTGGN